MKSRFRPRMGIPSPAMVVAVTALVVAMAGTGIAAKIVINGSQIKNGSITGKKFATGALVPKGYSMLVVPNREITRRNGVRAGASARAHTASTTGVQYAQICQSGVVTYSTPCPPNPPPGWTFTEGAPCPAGYESWEFHPPEDAYRYCKPESPPPGGTFASRFEVPEGAGLLEGWVTPNDAGAKFSTSLEKIEVATPTAPTEVSDMQMKLVGTPPGEDELPTAVSATLFTHSENLSSPKEIIGSCNFDPRIQEGCTVNGPLKLEAGLTYGWKIGIIDGDGLHPAWKPFSLSVGGVIALAK